MKPLDNRAYVMMSSILAIDLEALYKMSLRPDITKEGLVAALKEAKTRKDACFTQERTRENWYKSVVGDYMPAPDTTEVDQDQ